MKPAVALGVGDQTATFVVIVAALRVVFAARFGEVVVVDEVMARIVGRVDVDEFHLAGVGFLQDLERVEVVALDVEVLRGAPIFGLARLGNHRLVDGAARLGLGLALTRPSELITLTLAFSYITQKIAQRVEVHCTCKLTVGVLYLGHHLREQLGNLLDVFNGTVGRA